MYFHCMILYTWFFGGVRVAHLFSFFYVVLLCGFTFWVVLSIAILAQKRCSVRLYLQLCVGGHISYLCYLCLLTCSGVQNIYCRIFLLFFFVLCILCCQFLWMIHFWLPLRYSLTFIYLTVSLAFPFLVAILVSNIQYRRDLLSVNLFLIMNINLKYYSLRRSTTINHSIMTFEVCLNYASCSFCWLYCRQLLLLNSLFSNLSWKSYKCKTTPMYCDVIEDVIWSQWVHKANMSVGELISYLRYVCLFAHSVVQRILCCVFALFSLVLCTLCC